MHVYPAGDKIILIFPSAESGAPVIYLNLFTGKEQKYASGAGRQHCVAAGPIKKRFLTGDGENRPCSVGKRFLTCKSQRIQNASIRTERLTSAAYPTIRLRMQTDQQVPT